MAVLLTAKALYDACAFRFDSLNAFKEITIDCAVTQSNTHRSFFVSEVLLSSQQRSRINA